jgi:hypothetical protein
MSDTQRMAKIDDLIVYFRKGKSNELVEGALRDTLCALKDADFDRAINALIMVPNRSGLNLAVLYDALIAIGISAGSAAKEIPGYERVGSNGLIHKAVEVQCDCCGHHYLWSQTVGDRTSAEKNWWPSCPICGFDGNWQYEAHVAIKRTGKEPEAYRAMLDRQYRSYADRRFEPLKTQRKLNEDFATIKPGGYKDWKNVQSIISDLENSYKDRQRRYEEAQKEKVV